MAYEIIYHHESWIGENEVTLNDIYGYDKIKKELLEFIQHPLNHNEVYGQYQFIPTYGLLLYGPRGCGKTLLIKAIAKACNVHFISIKGNELLRLTPMGSQEKIKEIYEKARSAYPCLIFLDDLDIISGPGIVKDAIRKQLLQEMDELSLKYYYWKLIFFYFSDKQSGIYRSCLSKTRKN